MNNQRNKHPQILILSGIIPPEYSGAGISAYMIAEHLYKIGQLAFLVTRTPKECQLRKEISSQHLKTS